MFLRKLVLSCRIKGLNALLRHNLHASWLPEVDVDIRHNAIIMDEVLLVCNALEDHASSLVEHLDEIHLLDTQEFFGS